MYRIPKRGSMADATVSEIEAAVAPMLADGWTAESAWNHVQGMCDVTICSAPHGDDLALTCNNCGESFTDMQAAYEHGFSSPRDHTWCGDEGFVLSTADEAF